MNSDIITGVVFGVIGSMVLSLFIVVLVVLFIIMNNAKYNRLFRINNITAGQPMVEWYKGRLIKHPELGDCYHIKALSREGREFIQYNGSTFEYPTNKSKIKFVPLTYYQNVYAPEKYEFMEEFEDEQIVKNGKKYEKVIKKGMRAIVTPLKSSMRQFNLAADKAISNEYAVQQSFWDRNKATILSLAFVFMTVVLCVIMIVFTYQAAVDGAFANTPEWAKAILDAVTSGQAPPPTTPDITP